MLLNGRYYNYSSETWHEDNPLKNSSIEAQNGRQFNSVLGSAPAVFNVAFLLENTKQYNVGDSLTGATTWLGVSQLADLKSYLGSLGASQPLIYVVPYGVTYSVVPTGKIGVDIFNPSNPAQASAEFRITLQLESI